MASRQELITIADQIILNLQEQNLTLNEAIEVLKKVDGTIRTKRAELFSQVGNFHLKEIMKEEKEDAKGT